MDEALEDRHISIKSGFRARTILLSVWLLTGFLITSGYKSVLLSTLISIEYEKPIDTLEDMLKTDKAIIVEPSTESLYLSNDPRDSINELRGKITLVSLKDGHLENVTNSIFNNEAVLLSTDLFAIDQHSKIYKGKELLYSSGAAFMLPKSSPLRVCSTLLIDAICYWVLFSFRKHLTLQLLGAETQE